MAFGFDFKQHKSGKQMFKELKNFPSTTKNQVKLTNVFKQRKYTAQAEQSEKFGVASLVTLPATLTSKF